MTGVVDVDIKPGDLDPYIGDNVGLFIGVKHKGLTLTGTGTDWVFPEGVAPIMNLSNTGEYNKEDVRVYDDDVEVDVASFSPDDLAVVLEEAATGDVTGDLVELKEFIIAEDFNLQNKPKEIKWGRMRSSQEVTIYTGLDVTLEVNMKINSNDILKLGFDAVDHEIQTPPDVAAAVVFFKRNSNEVDWGFVIQNGNLVIDTLAKGKRNDLQEFGVKISAVSPIKLLEFGTYPLDTGIEG